MNKILATIALSIAISISISPIFTVADIAPLVPKVLSIQETIVKQAIFYAAPEKKLTLMFRCESQFNQAAIGAEGEIGVAQYKQGTFDKLSKLMGETLDIHSYSDQIKLTSWVSVHAPSEMQNWTTWRAIQNGGVYTFTSQKTKKKYTVICKE